MNSYKSKPIPPDTLIFDLGSPRFLKPEDLIERWKVENVTVTISRLAFEETIPSMSDIDPQTSKPKVVMNPVMYFKTKAGGEFPRGMLVSAKENLDALKAATGAKTTGELVGKQVLIIIGKHRKKPVLRISPDAPTTSSQQSAFSNQPSAVSAKSNGQPSKLEALQTMAQTDVITAFSDLCNSVGIDQETRTAILRECGGDFDAAYEKVSAQYREILS